MWREPISERYHPGGQATVVRARASLAAAWCTVLVSTARGGSMSTVSDIAEYIPCHQFMFKDRTSNQIRQKLYYFKRKSV